jgi:biopolymer transport protein ExbD
MNKKVFLGVLMLCLAVLMAYIWQEQNKVTMIEIEITSDNTLYLQGEECSFESLQTELEKIVQHVSKANRENLQATLKVDKNTKMGLIVDVKEALKANELKKLTYLSTP